MTEITKEMISEEKSVNNTLNQENMEDQNNIEKKFREQYYNSKQFKL